MYQISKRVCSALFYFSMLFCMGVSGCDNRTKIVVYRYQLSKCPQVATLPESAKNGEWELKIAEPRVACANSTYYLLSDEQWRNGGLGLPKAVNLYARTVSEPTCTLLLAFAFDVSTNPEKTLKTQSEAAAVALAQAMKTSVQIATKTTEVIDSNNFKKMCN